MTVSTCVAIVSTPPVLGAAMDGPADSKRVRRLSGVIDEALAHERALTPQRVAALAAREQPLSADLQRG